MTMLPDFIGIGAQRSATSWIYACLYEHPDVCAPHKEINFFSRERHWSKGKEWYTQQFKTCNPTDTIGEISTSYLSSKEAPKRIHNFLSDIKLFVCLRDPIDRAYSSYKNDVMDGTISSETSFEEAIKHSDKYIRMSRYQDHLERYFNYFSEHQIKILIYETINDQPRDFIQSIFSYLNINEEFTPSMLNERVNPGRKPKSIMLENTINKMANWFHSSRFFRPVWWTLKSLGVGTYMRNLNTEAEPQSEPKKSTMSGLRDQFTSDVRYLQSELEVNVIDQWDHWDKSDL